MAEPPALLTAINLTLTTIDRRIKLYRGLVVVVSAVLFGVPLTTVYFHTWMLLLGLGAVPLAVICYAFIDKHLVNGWADRMKTLTREKQLDLNQFTNTISSFRHLPAATVQTMLALISPPATPS